MNRYIHQDKNLVAELEISRLLLALPFKEPLPALKNMIDEIYQVYARACEILPSGSILQNPFMLIPILVYLYFFWKHIPLNRSILFAKMYTPPSLFWNVVNTLLIILFLKENTPEFWQ